MLRGLIAIFFFSYSVLCFGQEVISKNSITPKNDFDNIHVERLAGDSLSTSFMIWIRDTVKIHKHVCHSETIYLLEGEGMIYFNDSIIQKLAVGSIVYIPKDTWHAVKVTSEEPMQVLSVQSPGFYGKDRVFKTVKE